MNDTISLLKRRRSVPPPTMTGPAPTADELTTILTVASRVPDHGKLAPWRFVVIEGKARERAGALALKISLADKPDLDEAARAKEERRFVARAAGRRRRLARLAARQDPGVGTGSVCGRGVHEHDRRRPRARLLRHLAHRMDGATMAGFAPRSALPSTSASPVSFTSAGRRWRSRIARARRWRRS